MRVIGGQLRGRSFHGPPPKTSLRLRPTRDRVREALFNALLHGRFADPPAPERMRVLDLFAGTGSLGIEALSRGADWCTFVDTDPRARALIRMNLEALGLMGNTRVWRRDACDLARHHGPPFDLVMLDPPYGSGVFGQALRSAVEGGWLVERALAVVETASRDSATAPEGWIELFRRGYGETALCVLRRIAP